MAHANRERVLVTLSSRVLTLQGLENSNHSSRAAQFVNGHESRLAVLRNEYSAVVCNSPDVHGTVNKDRWELHHSALMA